MAQEQGDYAEARARLREGLALLYEQGDRMNTAVALDMMARLDAVDDHPQRAARLFGVAKAAQEANGVAPPVVDRRDHERAVAAARASLGDEAFEAAWTDGRAMGLEQGIAYALDQVG